MSSYYSYSDDDDIDIRVASRRRSPPVQYVQPPRHYYTRDPSPGYLDTGRTVISARSVSRDRSRGRRASSPPAPAPPPVVINNRIYHDYSSDDDDRRHLQIAKRARSRSRSRASGHIMTRDEFEMERARNELANLKMSNEMQERQKRTAKELQEEAELRRARDELQGIKAAQAREEEEKRIKKELEFNRLREEEREAEEQERREKEAEVAVERYKQKELERVSMERKEKERREKEYQRRLQEQLVQSGLNGDQVEAILKNEKIPEPKSDKPKPQYTRLLRKHLSLETLRTFEIEYAVDDQVRFPTPTVEQWTQLTSRTRMPITSS